MTLIVAGIVINIDRNKINPAEKSIQLPKSLNIPMLDFVKIKTPKNKSIWFGRFKLVKNRIINPTIKSIAPSVLTSIFFKPCNYF